MFSSLIREALLSLVLVLVAPSLALAENPHLAKGVRLLDRAEDDRALAELQLALRFRSSSPAELTRIHLYLGVTYFNLIKPKAAGQHFRIAFERDLGQSLPRDTSPKTAAFAEQIRSEVKRNQPSRPIERPPASRVVVHFTNAPPGALLWVDQQLVRAGPARPLVLQPGPHLLRVEARGLGAWSRTADLRAGEEVVFMVELGERQASRSGFWLGSTIVAAVLAAGAEAAALGLTYKANQEFSNTDSFDQYRRGAIGSHITAGVLSLAAGVSLVLWLRSGSTRVAVAAPGTLTARFDF